jgi:hypothetical protein
MDLHAPEMVLGRWFGVLDRITLNMVSGRKVASS